MRRNTVAIPPSLSGFAAEILEFQPTSGVSSYFCGDLLGEALEPLEGKFGSESLLRSGNDRLKHLLSLNAFDRPIIRPEREMERDIFLRPLLIEVEEGALAEQIASGGNDRFFEIGKRNFGRDDERNIPRNVWKLRDRTHDDRSTRETGQGGE